MPDGADPSCGYVHAGLVSNYFKKGSLTNLLHVILACKGLLASWTENILLTGVLLAMPKSNQRPYEVTRSHLPCCVAAGGKRIGTKESLRVWTRILLLCYSDQLP